MIRCSKCNDTPNEHDVIAWKCNSCGKAFQVTKEQLHNLLLKKETNPGESFFKCKFCGGILDDGKESIAWKCSCGHVTMGKLADFGEDVEIKEEIKEKEVKLEKEEVLPNTPQSHLIKCPECGKEISSKAKKCVHCGKVFVEDIIQKIFCSECGKQVDVSAKECPYCGCPLDEYEDEIKQQKSKKKKKIIILVAVVTALVVIVGAVLNFMKSSLSEDEQLAYQNAVELKSRMKNPDSFKLYDEMFLLKYHGEDGNVVYTYTIFKYGGANGYGAITTDEAIYKDGKYIMDYADEPDEDDSNYVEQLGVQLDLALLRYNGVGDTWEKVDIDVEKIKRKMGIE